MYQLTQLAAGQHRQRLAPAEAQRPAQRLLALARATRRAHPTASPASWPAGRCREPATARPAKTPRWTAAYGLGRQRDQRPEGRGERP